MRRTFSVFLVALIAAAGPGNAGAEAFRVVAHPGVEGSRIARSNLAAIYMRKVLRWGDRTSTQPVDQSSQSPVREAFSRMVLEASLGELQLYWRKRLVMDRVMPPPTKPSDEEVLAFVASHSGAIGYVSETVEIPPTVKLVEVYD